MSKILLKINNKDELLYPSDGYILGVKNFCICFGKTYTPSEIRKIKKKNDEKKVFASLNRVIFNNELKFYKETLKKLDDIGLDGIIVGDVAALSYELTTPITLDQLHLNNSSLTIEHYYNNGVNGIILTNDITLKETNDIKENNKKMLTFKQVFGLPHLSTSKRKLISNYLKHFNKSSNGRFFKIKENNSDNEYIILEDHFGTHILNGSPINLIDRLSNINADFFIFDGYLLNDFKWVLDAFMKNNYKLKDKIDDTFNSNEGFINQKTIYKVKNND